MTRDEAIALAKKHAAKSPHLYAINADQFEWRPHEWVVDAILEAYNDGFAEGAINPASYFVKIPD